MTLLLTDKAFWGVIPPPCDTAPGCGAPCGGNIFKGGGDIAAIAAIGAAAVAACSKAVASSSWSVTGIENHLNQLIFVLLYLGYIKYSLVI